ncbi:GrpB family protein [Eshraghiella crossota]
MHYRDCLNANENVALQYENLKKEMQSKYADDRVAYTKCKQNMINKILGK